MSAQKNKITLTKGDMTIETSSAVEAVNLEARGYTRKPAGKQSAKAEEKPTGKQSGKSA